MQYTFLCMFIFSNSIMGVKKNKTKSTQQQQKLTNTEAFQFITPTTAFKVKSTLG